MPTSWQTRKEVHDRMTPDSITAGLIVVNEGQKEWGLGKVVHVDPLYVSVYFKNIEGAPKNAIKKFRRDQNRLALAETQTDIALDNLPPIVIQGGIADFRARHRITEQQAIATFVRKYGSFNASLYEKHEGSYKRATHEYIAQNLLHGKGRGMLARGEYAELSTILKRITQQSGLLAVQERIALNDAFKDNDGTARFAS